MDAATVLDALSFSAADATLLAAIIAAGGGVTATTIGAINAAQSRRRADREQWWTRFIWAVDRSTARSAEESELGLRVLLDLIRTRWATKEDNQTAVAVASLIAARGERGRHHEGRGRRG